LWLNLLALPGLGSFLAGRRWTGVVQATLALAGLGLILWWALGFLAAWVRTLTFPENGGPHLLLCAIGALLSLTAWLWGLVTGLAVLGQTRTDQP
jgi:TM2 domain-containing membrane protein YozV